MTDVDVDKQRVIETRQALEQIMQGCPNLSQFTTFDVKPEGAASLSPEEILLMRKYTEASGWGEGACERKARADGHSALIGSTSRARGARGDGESNNLAMEQDS